MTGWAGWTACGVELALLEFFVSHFSVFFTVRIGVDAAANGLHPFQNDIFYAEICVDTDDIKPSQVSVS